MKRVVRAALLVGAAALVFGLCAALYSVTSARAATPAPPANTASPDAPDPEWAVTPLPPPRARAAGLYSHTLELPSFILPKATPEPPMRETRAVWVSRYDLWHMQPSSIDQMVENAVTAHLTTILFQVRGQADARYRSQYEPWSSYIGTNTLGQDPGWDPLAYIVEKAHARGLEVQAWLNVYPTWAGTTPPPTNTTPLHLYHDFNTLYPNLDWRQWNAAGPMELNSGYLSANPAFLAFQDHFVNVCKDILQHYAVDGLHLDYIRYEDSTYSVDPYSNAAYAAAAAATPGLTRGEWQRAQVTHLLQRIRAEALPLRPGARLTTSAWPIYKDYWQWFGSGTAYLNSGGIGGWRDRYQDSQGWVQNGVVDGIFPMLYGPSFTNYRDRFEALAQDFSQHAGPGAVILGVTGDYDSFDEIAWRIAIARQYGAAGVCIYNYPQATNRSYWQMLGEGPFKRAAVPAW